MIKTTYIYLAVIPGLNSPTAFIHANSAGSTCTALNLANTSFSSRMSEGPVFPFVCCSWSCATSSGDESIGIDH